MSLAAQLTTLETSGLIRAALAEPEIEYLFRHALVQEAAYESLLKQDRKPLHQAVGETLEAVYADRLEEIQNVLAYHYSRAEAWDKTLKHARAAADQAKKLYATVEALLYYDLALKALAFLDGQATAAEDRQHRRLQRFDILAERHGAATHVGQFEQSKADLQEMISVAREIGDDSRLADALTGLGYFYVNTGAIGNPYEPLEEALAIKRRLGDKRGQADSLNTLGTLYLSVGRVTPGLSALETAHDLYQQVEDRDGLARNEWTMGAVYYEVIGEYDRALAHLGRSIELCRALGNRALECGGLMMTGAVYARTGHFEMGQAYLGQALTLAKQIGDRPAEGWIWLYLSWPDRETGALDAGRTRAEHALNLGRDLGVQNLIWYALDSLARLYLVVGQTQVALRFAEQAYHVSQQAAVWVEVQARSMALLARVCSTLGQDDEARQWAQATLHMLEALHEQGVAEAQAVYFNCYLALRTIEAPKAPALLRRAHAIVMAQADSIADPVWRTQFLKQVAVNREIVEAWTSQTGEK